MAKEQLFGCGTALVTPFTTDGVDYQAYRFLLQRQFDAGIHFLVALGTSAETACLTAEEKCEILRITMEMAGDTKVIAGAGCYSTAATIETINMLEPYDPFGYLIVTPYYNKPTQEGLYQHFKAVADSTSKPIVLYNVPGRTGINLNAETTLRLAEIPNIIAVKEASANYSQIYTIIRNAPEGFSVFSGNDDETFPLMMSGAKGIISVASNIAPKMMVALVEHIRKNETADALDLNKRLWPLFKNCFVESNPIPVKAGLYKMGLMQNIMRLPLTSASEKTMALMEMTVKGLY